MSIKYPIKDACDCLDLMDKIALEIILNAHIDSLKGQIKSREEFSRMYPIMAERMKWKSQVQMKQAEIDGYQRLREEIISLRNCEDYEAELRGSK